MKKFYVVHVEVSRNIGNYEYELVCTSLEEAKAKQIEINNYNSNENISLRDAYAHRISTHSFKDSSDLFNNEKYRRLSQVYFDQHGEFPY